MTDYEALREKNYDLPEGEDALYDAKTALIILLGVVDLFDPHPVDEPQLGAMSKKQKMAKVPEEKERALAAIQELTDKSETFDHELNVLAEAVFALVQQGKIAEAQLIVQVPISQIREKLLTV